MSEDPNSKRMKIQSPPPPLPEAVNRPSVGPSGYPPPSFFPTHNTISGVPPPLH